MNMVGQLKTAPRNWLGFELNVLRRLTFKSIAIPLANDGALGSYLKRWDARVSTNHPLQSVWAKTQARVPNNSERLSSDDVNTVLEDAYVPGYKLRNPVLRNWFNETDSWWFDNVRTSIERLPTPIKRAVASSVAMAVGDYVLSFNDETMELRQPLSNVFRRIWTTEPEPVNNGQNNTSHNKIAEEFIAESQVDLMFLKLPRAHPQATRTFLGRTAWREEWIRGGTEFWRDYDAMLAGRLSSATETKSQYLHVVQEALRTAGHIETLVIAHTEDGFISTQDLLDAVRSVRSRLDRIFTKDFSELTGAKAVIITA
jgi:hypothetical protein